jgi:hypothetical protein
MEVHRGIPRIVGRRRSRARLLEVFSPADASINVPVDREVFG